jgi:hypothetical protein
MTYFCFFIFGVSVGLLFSPPLDEFWRWLFEKDYNADRECD